MQATTIKKIAVLKIINATEFIFPSFGSSITPIFDLPRFTVLRNTLIASNGSQVQKVELFEKFNYIRSQKKEDDTNPSKSSA